MNDSPKPPLQVTAYVEEDAYMFLRSELFKKRESFSQWLRDKIEEEVEFIKSGIK